MDAFFITLPFQIFGFKMKRNELVSFEDKQLTKRSYKKGDLERVPENDNKKREGFLPHFFVNLFFCK